MSAEWVAAAVAIVVALGAAACVVASYGRMGGKIETRLDNFEQRLEETGVITNRRIDKTNVAVGGHSERIAAMEATCKARHPDGAVPS